LSQNVHEPAVVVHSNNNSNNSSILRVVQETDSVLAIDKPTTLPVHPCGGYHQNSVMNILTPTSNNNNNSSYDKLFTIHRLDRLTSGLLLLAKTSDAAREWGRAIQDRACQKLYLARVQGRFAADGNFNGTIPRLTGAETPVCGEWTSNDEDDRETAASLKDDGTEDSSTAARRRHAHGYWLSTNCNNNNNTAMSLQDYANTEHSIDEWLEALNATNASAAPAAENSSSNNNNNNTLVWLNLACPVRVEKPIVGVCASGVFADLDAATYTQTVKPAQTAFAVIHYNENDDSTLVLVRPDTGRTHQIRIHLQYLGHSIANDPNYGGSLWFGNPEGQRACEEAQRILDSEDDIDNDNPADDTKAASAKSLVTTDTAATESEVAASIINNGVRGDEEPLEEFIQRTCVWCARSRGRSVRERAELEFLVRSPGLWLHAFQYTFESTSFRTELPEWCQFDSK